MKYIITDNDEGGMNLVNEDGKLLACVFHDGDVYGMLCYTEYASASRLSHWNYKPSSYVFARTAIMKLTGTIVKEEDEIIDNTFKV